MPPVARPHPTACLITLRDAAKEASSIAPNSELENAFEKAQQTASRLLAVENLSTKIVTKGIAAKSPEVKEGMLSLDQIRRDIVTSYSGLDPNLPVWRGIATVLEQIGHFNPIITACQTNGRHF